MQDIEQEIDRACGAAVLLRDHMRACNDCLTFVAENVSLITDDTGLLTTDQAVDLFVFLYAKHRTEHE